MIALMCLFSVPVRARLRPSNGRPRRNGLISWTSTSTVRLALHNYHDTHKKLPSGIVASNQLAWSALILPFLEQGALHDAMDGAGAFDRPWEDFQAMTTTGSPPLAKTVVDGYICPSDTGEGLNENLGDFGKSNYMGLYTAHYHPSDPVATNGGSDRLATFYDNSGRKFRDFTDGLSNTIIVAERRTRTGSSGPCGSLWVGYHNDFGGAITGSVSVYQIRIRMERASNDTDYIINGNSSYSPSSHHPGGAQFLRADGSVVFLSETINLRTQAALGTIDGGEVIGEY